jgi:DNA-directed RNA polymerase subunit N (RpoN/RPB10)
MTEEKYSEFDDAAKELKSALDEIGVEKHSSHRTKVVSEFTDLVEDAVEKENCDHEDAAISIDPQTLERPAGELLGNPPEEGYLSTFRARCEDCGAELAASLKLTVDRNQIQ